MDYLSLKAATAEAERRFSGRKVQDACQLSPMEIALYFRGAEALVMSINPSRPGLFILEITEQVSDIRTAFAQLLSSKITGTVLGTLRLPEPGERLVFLDFAAGWPAKPGNPVRIAFEVMGRHSNLSVLQDGIILQPLKTVPDKKSRVRPVLPGEPWTPPPPRPGIALENITPEDLPEASYGDVHDLLVRTVRGLSPYSSGQAVSKAVEDGREALFQALDAMSRSANGENGYLHRTGGRAYLTPFEPVILNEGETFELFTPFSAAAARWREEGHDKQPAVRDEEDQLADNLRSLKKRLNTSIENLDRELERCRSHENIRLMAETLLVHASEAKQGQSSITLPNPYDPEEGLAIELDPSLSVVQNAEKMFTDAHRLKRGIRETAQRRREVEEELAAVDRSLNRLLESGDTAPAKSLLKTKPGQQSGKGSGTYRAYAGPGKRYFLDGYTVLVGKSALDNEKVTFQAAGPHDLWLHARDYPGSHVVILAGKKKVPDNVLYRAAELAAEGSGAKDEKSPEIMVTERKWVKKLKGGQPGKVTVERFKTIRPRSG